MLRPGTVVLFCGLLLAPVVFGQERKTPLYTGALGMQPPHIATDKTVKYDYDIV